MGMMKPGADVPQAQWHTAWRRDDERGEEEFSLLEFESAAHWLLTGLLDMPADDKALWVRYAIACDVDWRTKRLLLATANDPLALERFPEETPLLMLSADGNGNWHVGEEDRPNLHGCLDIDLGCSPSTNTLPIRRLKLSIGESAEVTAAWVRFPDLTVQPLRQRYTCLAHDRYRYESLESGFTVELTVDEQGLVVDYPGGWRRKPRLVK